MYARHAATVKSPSLNVRLYECVVESTFSSLSPTGLLSSSSSSLFFFSSTVRYRTYVRVCTYVRASSGDFRPKESRKRSERGNALAFGSSSVRRIEREGNIVGFDHGWRKGIFSPLLITDVLILREEVEREIDTPLWESIYPSVYLSGKEEGIEFELTFDGRPWKESAITTIIATISFPRKLPPRSLPWERNVSRCAVISSSYAQPTFPSS